MNRKGYAFVVLLSVVVACYCAEGASVVAREAEVEKLAGNFNFTEGPAADVEGNVYFTDIPNNRIHKWSLDGKLNTFRENSGGANGLFFDKSGNLLICEGGGRRLISISPRGKVTVLAERYQNKRFNSLNDLWIDPKGGVYFTDPRYGPRDGMEQDGEHVYYLSPDRKDLVRVIDDMTRPNGVIGTADGRKLYVADHGAGKTFSYAINGDGTLSDKELLAPEGSDGMTIDNEGNIYLTTSVVAVYNKNGEKIEEIKIPERPANVCFGGKDRRTLFITARTSLYSIKMRVKDGRRSIFYNPLALGNISVSIATPSLLGRPLPELKDLNVELPADASDKMVLVCFFDVEQRPSRNIVQLLAEKAEDLAAEGVEVVCIQTSDVDEKSLSEWVRDKNIHFPIARTSAERGKSAFEWGAQSLPWLILTDRTHIVVAEGLDLGDINEKIMQVGAGPNFEQDIINTDAGDLRICFIGHGTLMFTFNGMAIHVDPVGRQADYTKMPKADIILLTHEHGDHLDTGAIETLRNIRTRTVLTKACKEKGAGGVVMQNGDVRLVRDLKIEAVPAYNIVHKRSGGQPYHPEGRGNGYIVTFGDKRVYIAGDTENTPEMKKPRKIDVAFLPMNLPYTMTPEMVADAAKAFLPKVLYPYHYGQTDPNRLVELLKDTKSIEVRIRKMQ